MYQVKIVKGKTKTVLSKKSRESAIGDLYFWSELGNDHFEMYIDDIKMHTGTAAEILEKL